MKLEDEYDGKPIFMRNALDDDALTAIWIHSYLGDSIGRRGRGIDGWRILHCSYQLLVMQRCVTCIISDVFCILHLVSCILGLSHFRQTINVMCSCVFDSAPNIFDLLSFTFCSWRRASPFHMPSSLHEFATRTGRSSQCDAISKKSDLDMSTT